MMVQSGRLAILTIVGMIGGWVAAGTAWAAAGGGVAPPGTPEPPAFTLTVVVAGSGTGKVTSNPPGINCPGDCSHQYPIAVPWPVTLTASDGTGVFTGWSGACSGMGPCNLAIGSNTSVTANFTKSTLFLRKGGPGAQNSSVTSSPRGIDCGTSCRAEFSPGQEVTLNLQPGSGFVVTGMSGDCTGVQDCRVTMQRAQHGVTVNFGQAAQRSPGRGQPQGR